MNFDTNYFDKTLILVIKINTNELLKEYNIVYT